MTSYNFQNSATEYAINLINLHNYICYILIVVFAIVTWLIYKILRHFSLDSGSLQQNSLNQSNTFTSIISYFNNLYSNYISYNQYNFFKKTNIKDYNNLYVLRLFDTVNKILLNNNLFYVLKKNSNLNINSIYNLEENLLSMFKPLAKQIVNFNLDKVGFLSNNKISNDFIVLNATLSKKLLGLNNASINNTNTYLDFKYFHSTLKNNLGFIFFENLRHATKLEIFWTILPTLILVFIALPSFNLLYSYDEPLNNPCVTLKAIGHQWYWSYEYTDFASDKIEFDSYMVGEADLNFGQLRLLEVDNRVVLPVGVTVRVLISSTDVLHSWAMPSFAVKADAVPGRLNQVILLITRPGVFYGQCSELCGVQHGFMPIVIEAVGIEDYYQWVSKMIS